jgi:hypothetical protein
MAETGGVRERWLSAGPGSEFSRRGAGEPWVEIVGRLLLSLEIARECTPDRTMTDSKFSEPRGEKVNGDGGVVGRGVVATFSVDISVISFGVRLGLWCCAVLGSCSRRVLAQVPRRFRE